jgi:hypothetical protein
MSRKLLTLLISSSALVCGAFADQSSTDHKAYRAYEAERKNTQSLLHSKHDKGLPQDIANVIGKFAKPMEFGCPATPHATSFDHDGLKFELLKDIHATSEDHPPAEEFLTGGKFFSPNNLVLKELGFEKHEGNMKIHCDYQVTHNDSKTEKQTKFLISFEANIPHNLDLSTAKLQNHETTGSQRQPILSKLSQGQEVDESSASKVDSISVDWPTSNTVVAFAYAPPLAVPSGSDAASATTHAGAEKGHAKK